MTKRELTVKLRNFPYNHERRRKDLVERLSALCADKDTLISGARAQSFDTFRHGNKTSDPTGNEVVALEKRFGAEISALHRQINDVMDEIELLTKALEWLRLQGGQYYNVVYYRYIKTKGWNSVGANVGFTDRWSRKQGDFAIEKMLSWINR